MNSGRVFYVDVLKDILLEKTTLNVEKDNVKESERAFFNMLMMTTFRNLTFVRDEVLPLFIKKRIPQKQKILEYVLYLGAVEILFLETPVYAVINSYVEVAKKRTDKFGGNFVNAVLRNIARKKEEIIKNRKSGYFSKQFLEIIKNDYSKKEIEEMEEYANIEPMLDLTYKPNIKPKFSDGILLDNGSVRLESSVKVAHLLGFEEGDFFVQDYSSSMAIRALDTDLKDKKVLDLCAAPGGKTAQLLSYGANVLAVDISEERLNILEKNIKRLKLEKNLRIVCSNALDFDCNEKFDIVLVDAPCSATGTFRRHPEIINIKNISDVKKMVEIQEKILQKAASFVDENGILVYATCSLAKDEGERQIFNFINKNKDFEVREIKLKKANKSITKDGFLRILPQHLKDFLGADGFFVACLQRKN